MQLKIALFRWLSMIRRKIDEDGSKVDLKIESLVILGSIGEIITELWCSYFTALVFPIRIIN